MKKIFIPIMIFTAAFMFSIAGCDKNDVNLIDENNKWLYLDSSNSANIKVIQVFAGNTPQVPTAPNSTTGPQVFIYANGKKLNGTVLSYGGVSPIPNVYANIPVGTTRFDIINGRMNLSVVPNVPAYIAGDTLATFTATLDKGKYYSLYIGDTVPTVRVTMKEDLFPIPEYQTYKVRLANFCMNPTDTFSLFSRRQNAEIITSITHKNVSDWVQISLPIIADTLDLRRKGSTTSLVALTNTFPTLFPVGQRMYTVVARGKTGVTSKGVTASLITNR
jgi:hypothetical protein